MTKKLARGKPFEKGNKKGRGRPPMSEDQKKIARLTRNEVMDAIALIVKGNRQDILNLKNNPKTNILRAWIGSVAMKGIKLGDMEKLDKLLTRAIGKPKEEIEVLGNAVQVLVNLPGNGSEKKKTN